MKIAILDDYHEVALRYADWSGLGADITAFRDALPQGPARARCCSPSMSSWPCANAPPSRPN